MFVLGMDIVSMYFYIMQDVRLSFRTYNNIFCFEEAAI